MLSLNVMHLSNRANYLQVHDNIGDSQFGTVEDIFCRFRFSILADSKSSASQKTGTQSRTDHISRSNAHVQLFFSTATDRAISLFARKSMISSCCSADRSKNRA